MSRPVGLGKYGEYFGAPEFDVSVSDGNIAEIKVIRGAPCGATWKAAEKVTGLPVEKAIVRIGLETQFFCSADPASWDPITEKSPVHIAGKLHSKMLQQKLRDI